MKNTSNNEFNENYDDEIYLSDLFKVLLNKKFLIAGITLIFTLVSILYALMLPNIYKSEAIMMPVETNSGMSAMLGQYSGMASLAGISLDSKTTPKSKEAIARIQSLEFFSNHILPFIALEDLLAVEKWDPISNTVIYDKAIFNSGLNEWVQKTNPSKPTSQKAYETYKEIISITENKSTSFISLSVVHKSPFIAQKWVELVINQIDKSMRERDKQDAIKAIEYLNSIVSTVNYEELKNALSSLQEEQMKQLMMVEANENYIFKVLDSPVAPERKFEPRRSVIVVLGTFLGIIFGMLFALIMFYKNTLPAK